MTSVKFENSTLADVIRRAAAVAPTRGDAFDKTAGIIMRIDPAKPDKIVIMATDTVLFFMEIVKPLEVTGEAVTWRIPSMIFSQLVSKLPIGGGATVLINDNTVQKRLEIKSARTVARINIMDPQYYPMWEPFNSANLEVIDNFGDMINQVSWASSNIDVNMNGVGFGPGFIGSADRQRAALVTLNHGINDLFIIPSKVLSQIIPNEGEIRVGKDGSSLLVMPNEYTQIRVTVIEPFVNLTRFVGVQFMFTSRIIKADVVQMITQALDFKGGDRLSRVAVIVGRSEFALHVDNPELGMFGSVVQAFGDAENHKRITIEFNPDNLRAALAAFPGDIITMSYNDETEPSGARKVYFTNEVNYHSVVAPLAKHEPAPEPA